MTSLQIDVLFVSTMMVAVFFMAISFFQILIWDIFRLWRFTQIFGILFLSLASVQSFLFQDPWRAAELGILLIFILIPITPRYTRFHALFPKHILWVCVYASTALWMLHNFKELG